MNFERGQKPIKSLGIGKWELYRKDPKTYIAKDLCEMLRKKHFAPNEDIMKDPIRIFDHWEMNNRNYFMTITTRALDRDERFSTKRIIRNWIHEKTPFRIVMFRHKKTGRIWTHFELEIFKPES